MANPFKEAEKRKKTPPGAPEARVETPVETPGEKPTEPIEEKTNPLAGMIETKKTGKTQAYYLSMESIDKLNKLAKMNKCSASKALDMLIKNTL